MFSALFTQNFEKKNYKSVNFKKLTFWLVYLDQCIALEAIKKKSPTISFICYKVQSIKIPKGTSKHYRITAAVCK